MVLSVKVATTVQVAAEHTLLAEPGHPYLIGRHACTSR